MLFCVALFHQIAFADDEDIVSWTTMGEPNINIKYRIDSEGTLHFAKGEIQSTDDPTLIKTFDYSENELYHKIIKVQADDKILVRNNGTASLFEGCFKLAEADLTNFDLFDPSNTNFSKMFEGCTSLQKILINQWDTSNINNMSYMFYNCQSLESLDVSNWDTSNVTNMEHLFANCKKLTVLDVSKWNTSNVTNMRYLFFDCRKLTKLDVSNWNTANVTDMSYLFYYCSGITELNVSSWNTSNVTDMHYLFTLCSELTGINVSSWDTSNVTDMSGMFASCSKLQSLDVSKWKTGSVTNMASMFQLSHDLRFLNVSGWDTSKVTDMSRMFDNCLQLQALDVSNWKTGNVMKMNFMFGSCESLTSLDVSGWDTSKVTIMNHMFYLCKKLISINPGSWDTSEVTNMTFMFYYTDLTELDMHNWDTSKVTDMNSIFRYAPLQKLILGTDFRFTINHFDLYLNTGYWTYIKKDANITSHVDYGTEYLSAYNSNKFSPAYNNNPDTMAGTWVLNPVPVIINGVDETHIYDNSDFCTQINYRLSSTDERFTDTQAALVTYSGENQVCGKEPGEYPYHLDVEKFSYTGSDYYVYFKLGTDGKLLINNPTLMLTITAASSSKTYDGTALKAESWTSSGLTEGDTITSVTVTGSQTNAGSSANVPSGAKIKNQNGEDVTDNYTISYVNGKLEVNKFSNVTVTIVGESNTTDYDGQLHEVNGYTASASTPLYQTTGDRPDFSFTGTAFASRRDSGTSPMGLKPEMFSNTNTNFETVTFHVTDGYQTINKINVTVTIKGNSDTTAYDGQSHTVSGHTATADTNLYNVNNSFTFTGTASATRTDAGTSQMGLSSDQFRNENTTNFNTVKFLVTDGYLTIIPIDTTVTITGHHATAPYNGENHTVSGYDVSIGNLLYSETDFSFSGTAEAERTEAGTTNMGLTANQFANKNQNFRTVKFSVTDGYQQITPINAAVKITGHGNSSPYDGNEHRVEGYDVQIETPLYKTTDFTFSGTAEAKRTDAGTTPMGLTASRFSNSNPNFDVVTFNITDGYQTITPMEEEIIVTIKGHTNSAVYDKTEHSTSGYDVTSSNPLYTEADISFSGSDETKCTNAGICSMGLTAEQFSNINPNFSNVKFQVTDGYQEITALDGVTVTIHGHNDTEVYSGSPYDVVRYDVSVSNPLYTEADFTFSGSDTPARTNTGMAMMGLKAEQFTNINPNFTNVIFNVTDGSLTIIPKDLSDGTIRLILDPQQVIYDGQEHTVSYSVYDSERGVTLIESVEYELIPEESTLQATEIGIYTVVVSADYIGETDSNITTKAVSGRNYSGRASDTWQIIPKPADNTMTFFPIFDEGVRLPNTGLLSNDSVLSSIGQTDLDITHLGMTLQIPSLDVIAEIVQLPFEGSTWSVDNLEYRAGLLSGSAIPGKGYSIIAAHNTLNSSELGPFASLSSMKKTDTIFINDKKGIIQQYTVYENTLLEPDDFKGIASIAEQKPGALILVTCENESVNGEYLNRRVIFAEPLSENYGSR